MNVSIVMPQLGLTMTEGCVSDWLKKPGDPVHKGEPLFVVSTDKADMEIESPADGTLGIPIVGPGQVVPVGTVLAHVESSAETLTTAPLIVAPPLAEPSSAPREKASSAALKAASTRNSAELRKGLPPASPRARRLARQLGIDIGSIRGSGVGSRIVEEDVRRVASELRARRYASSDHRKLIAEAMVKSVQTIPHFSLRVEACAEQWLSQYEGLRPQIAAKTGRKLTLTDLFLKALGVAVLETPAINTVWAERDGLPRSEVDLGLAIATDRGVVAPVIRNVATLDLAEIVSRREGLVDQARARRLSLDDLQGGVGTLSNMGMYRVDDFQAMIDPKQSFILAVGKIAHRPWVVGATLTVRPTVRLNLTVDHRVADGEIAARLLEKLCGLIENPAPILES